AWRHAEDYAALLYATADTPAAVTANLAALAGPHVLDLPERDERDLTRQAAAVVRWLEANPGWLLILDNVDTDAAKDEIERLLPRLNAGHVVITSRRDQWGRNVAPFPMGVLDERP